MQTFLSGHIPLGSQKSSNSNMGKANEIVVNFLTIKCIFIPLPQLIKPLFIWIYNYVYYDANTILLCYNVMFCIRYYKYNSKRWWNIFLTKEPLLEYFHRWAYAIWIFDHISASSSPKLRFFCKENALSQEPCSIFFGV